MQEKKEEYIERMRLKSADYTKWWHRLRAIHNILQFITLAGAGTVPLLLTIPQVPN
jgi:hypothetical protein